MLAWDENSIMEVSAKSDDKQNNSMESAGDWIKVIVVIATLKSIIPQVRGLGGKS